MYINILLLTGVIILLCCEINMCIHNTTNLRALDIDDFIDSCEYESPYKKIEHDPADLKLLQLNIRGLNSKIADLLNLTSTCLQPGAILLSETWLKKHSPIPRLPGYQLERNDRIQKKGGGVCIWIQNNCKYRRLKELEAHDNECLESCFVEITTNTTKMILGSIYRPPNTNPIEFIGKLNKILELARKFTKHIAIGLDHNLDLLKCERHKPTQDFLELLYDNNMIPTITKPTRITTSSATLIDNILINMELGENTTSGIIEDNISDHLPCFITVKGLDMPKKSRLEIMSRDVRPKQLKALKRKLSENPDLLLPQHEQLPQHENEVENPDLLLPQHEQLPQHENEVDWQFQKFHDALLHEIDHYLPIRTRRINPYSVRREKWVSAGLLISIKRCKKLYRKHIRKRHDHGLFQKYKRYNSELKRVKRAAKKMHYENQCKEYRSNTQKLWKTINTVIRKTNNKTETIDSLKIGNLEVFNGNEIANEFAKYFSSIGKDLASKMKIPKTGINTYLKNVRTNAKSIFLTPVTTVELGKIISKLKPKLSSGLDEINNKIIKELKDFIVPPLSVIFNNSLMEGIFPKKMKEAKVVPLFKSKERNLATNYRPISLLLTLSKLLEKLMYSRVYNFLVSTDQLYASQYGFRKMHSCEHAVGELIANIAKGIEKGKYTAGIFLDLSKAFDTLEHEVVYMKLEKYGLRGNCLKWFQSYLGDRSLIVECKTGDSNSKTSSNSYPVDYGTPQGSCLGPLIFLIFCNDLQNHLIFLSCIQFADDTTLYITHCKISYIRSCIEIDLATLKDWFLSNKLTLNVGKSVCILFGQKSKSAIQLQISLGNEHIPQVKSTKFLGMWIDESLSWNEHVTKVILKLKSRVNLLKMSQHFLGKHALKVLYYAQLHSVLSYGIVMWGSLASQANLNKLQKIQNTCIRIIDKPDLETHTLKTSYKNLKIPDVSQMIDIELLKLWHKYQLDQLPQKLRDAMSTDHKDHRLVKTHDYDTRRKNLINLPLAKHAKYQRSFLVEGLRLYNQLPPTLLCIKKYKSFCSKLKNHYIK